MNVIATALPGVLIVEPRIHADARGSFAEVYHEQRYAQAGIVGSFVQDNHSISRSGVLRGLHFQKGSPQGKLVLCLRGTIWDVAADIRPSSPTFQRWVGVELSATNRRQLWVPPGFAHGFCVLADDSEVLYKCTALYDPADEGGIIWNDASLGIAWPVTTPILSPRDAAWPSLAASLTLHPQDA